MATIKKFVDLEIWQLARTLNKDIFTIIKTLSENKHYELASQLERSVASIMDNVAEGFERDGNREFIQFLAISKGSAGEARSQLYRALDRGLINDDQFVKFQTDLKVIEDKIGRFMNYLVSSNLKGKKFPNKENK